MHPIDFDEKDMVYILRDENGNEFRIKNLEIVEPIYDDIDEHPQWLPDPAEMEFTATIRVRKLSGMLDAICGWTWTGAARRYTRWTKRMKEKKRRLRLKEGK